MNTYNLKKLNFYKCSSVKDYYRTFLVNVGDDLIIEDKQILSGVYFNLEIRKKNDNLHISIKLYCWSNKTQSNVPLEQSIWTENDFGGGKHIVAIRKHYDKIINNLFYTLETLKYHWQIKDMIYKMEHHTFIFHYKLLNLFTQKELENIFLKNFKNYPILNIPMYKTIPTKSNFRYSFLPHVINGFYIYGLEVSVDINSDDSPVIEDDNGKITKEQFFKELNKIGKI